MKALAIDVGGTKIYNTIINEKGEIIDTIQKHSTPKTFDDFIKLFKAIIEPVEDEIDCVAIATAGAVNNDNNRVISSTGNLIKNYKDIDFQSLSKKPVFLENDANAAAWAEHIIGVTKNCPNSIMLTLGTGVGGGIILNNRLFKGKSGAAGEMHFKMYPDKRRKCTCGSYDCFEAYASGSGLKKTAEEMLNNLNVTTYDVIEGVKNSDEKMKEIFDTWQNYILQGSIGLANLFDPDCIVFSGSMAQFIDTDFLEKSINAEIVTTPLKVYKAQTQNYAGMIGVALLALEKINGES